MKKAFAGRFLDQGYLPRRRFANNAGAAAYLQRMALADLDGTPVLGPSPKSDERISRTMAAEFVAAVNRSGGKSAMHWYTDSIARMIRIASMMHPEIGDDAMARGLKGSGFSGYEDARTVLFCAMAITSQNVPVHENMGYALEQYRIFRETGRFSPKGYGIRGASVMKNLERFNHLVEVANGDLGQVREFLATEFRMGDLRHAATKVGMTLGGRELNDETVWGSMIFGPKIGNGFYQNLSGNLAPVTIDMWFMRTWGRYTGTLVRHSVSDAQVERLVGGLANLGEPYLSRALANGFDPDADLATAEPEDLLDTCKALVAAWERERRDMVAEGMDNATVSERKAALTWPSAALSIVKSISHTVDAPANAGQRRWIRSVVGRTLAILKDNGYEVTAADAQAVLWYPEKNLYQLLVDGKITNSLNVAYDEALREIAVREGYSDAEIESGIRAVEPDGSRRQGNPGAVGRGLGRAVQGLPERSDEAPARAERRGGSAGVGRGEAVLIEDVEEEMAPAFGR